MIPGLVSYSDIPRGHIIVGICSNCDSLVSEPVMLEEDSTPTCTVCGWTKKKNRTPGVYTELDYIFMENPKEIH